MCHQSTVTGSAAAADGAADPAALGAATLGAAALAGALLAEPPLEQALIVSARTPSNPSVRLGFDMTGPPAISTLLLGWVRRMSGAALSS
jgi:hypothetical protein